MADENRNMQLISIALIAIAVILSGLSYSNTMGLKGRLDAVEDLSTEISGDVNDLKSSVASIQEALGEIQEPEPTEPEPTEPVILRIGYSSAPRDLDPPHYGDDFLNGIDQLVHEPLFRMWWGDSGEIIFKPILVESYEQVDDLTWDFTIRQGIKFSDGTDLDIQDVYWSLSRNDPRPGNMIWSLDARIESYEILDDWTIRMVTKYPMNNLYAWLCQGWTNIVSYDWVVATNNENNYPMVGIPPGTGPWMWYEIEPMVYAKMKLNPYWEGPKPKIDEIHIFAAPDDTARVIALQAGTFDFIFPTPIEAVESLEEKGYKLWVKPTPIMQQIQINNVYPPMDNVKVRQALAHSINREELVPTIWGKYAFIMDSPAPVGTTGYKDYPLYDYDPDKARQLLEEAGYPEGVSIEMYVAQGNEKHLEAATAIKTYAAAVGIDINLILMESTAMGAIRSDERNRWMAGEDVDFTYHLELRGWHADTLWAGDDLFSLYQSDQNTNRWYIDDPELDDLLAIGISLAPMDERIAAVEEAQRIWMEKSYGVMLYAAPYIYTTVPNLENIYTEPNVYVWFEDAYFR